MQSTERKIQTINFFPAPKKKKKNIFFPLPTPTLVESISWYYLIYWVRMISLAPPPSVDLCFLHCMIKETLIILFLKKNPPLIKRLLLLVSFFRGCFVLYVVPKWYIRPRLAWCHWWIGWILAGAHLAIYQGGGEASGGEWSIYFLVEVCLPFSLYSFYIKK